MTVGAAESTRDGGKAASAAESNGAAARRGLWDALDTTHCGHPEVVREFFAAVPAGARIVDMGCWNGAIAELAVAPWSSSTGIGMVPGAIAEFGRGHVGRAGMQA